MGQIRRAATIHKSKIRKCKVKKHKKKRVLPDCQVELLSYIEGESSALLKRLSGIQVKSNDEKSIAMIGCGSLGSKIGIHLARHGNGPFLCIDNDIFLPHNKARHALTFPGIINKAENLSLAMYDIGKILSPPKEESAETVDYTESRLIIDTTASLSVRNFLMSENNLPPIISAGLYNRGQYGLLLLENRSKTNRLINIWAYIYYQTLSNQTLREILFNSTLKNINIGLGCSSLTMIAADAQISFIAASMSLKIQNIIDNGLSNNSEILLITSNDDYSLNTELITVPDSMLVKSTTKKDWQVILSIEAYYQMKELMNKKKPNETGGVLLGTIFLYARKIVITGILPPPPDSEEKTGSFVLGHNGLAKQIKTIEQTTNGKVTYLGTWHSHPYGGSASNTDNTTYKKLLFVRNYEPTVCLIITPKEVFLV